MNITYLQIFQIYFGRIKLQGKDTIGLCLSLYTLTYFMHARTSTLHYFQ